MTGITYTPEIAQEICEDITRGLSLRAACAIEGRPDKVTFLRWVAKNDELRNQYVRAREAQAEHFADEIIEIIDTEADPNRARVRMDGRKWVAAKQAPKKYGDRLETDNHHTHDLADPLTALLTKIGERGRRIYDPEPGEPG